MGQAEIIEFLEKEFYKNPEKTFTKKEIEIGIRKKVKDYSLKSLVEYGEIAREREIIKTKNGMYKQFRYKYLPNGSFTIIDFRKR